MKIQPTFRKLEISGLVVIEPMVFEDGRGFVFESYHRKPFVEAGITDEFVQDNHVRSSAGVLRGMHFQNPPHTQSKLVRCTRGRVYDVAVDVRKESPTYGKWAGVELSEESKKMFYIPEGFAHGFLALVDGTEFQYKMSADYAPDQEGGVHWNDPDLAIDWPDVGVEFNVKGRDEAFPRLKDLDSPFTYK